MSFAAGEPSYREKQQIQGGWLVVNLASMSQRAGDRARQFASAPSAFVVGGRVKHKRTGALGTVESVASKNASTWDENKGGYTYRGYVYVAWDENGQTNKTAKYLPRRPESPDDLVIV